MTYLSDLKLPGGGARSAPRFVYPWYYGVLPFCTTKLFISKENVNYAHHAMLVKFVLFFKKVLHYSMMICLFLDKYFISMNVSWGLRAVLTSHKKNYLL